MRKKFLAGAAILALLIGSPQVKAEDDIVIFGGEFEDEATPEETPKPKPVKELPPPEEKPQPPIEQEKPEVKPEEIKPEIVKPKDEPPIQPQENLPPDEDDDDDLGDVLIFDDLSNLPNPKSEPARVEPVDEPTEEPQPPKEPAQIEPRVEPLPQEIEHPFADTTDISGGNEQIEEPITQYEPQIRLPIDEPKPIQPANDSETKKPKPPKKLKTLEPRFVKLAVDDTYTYYLDKNSVQWKRMPYSASEYIADVWIRMVERTPTALDDDMESYGEENFNAEISLAREQGYQYPPEDLQVLIHQSYVLEHYYLRPKTNQIQFLCELEVFGRPQNTINERAYDYKNWENLVPGSVESVVYATVMKNIGTKKASEKGHMTFIDMLEEYGRISLR